jgi:hypothetical protein
LTAAVNVAVASSVSCVCACERRAATAYERPSASLTAAREYALLVSGSSSPTRSAGAPPRPAIGQPPLSRTLPRSELRLGTAQPPLLRRLSRSVSRAGARRSGARRSALLPPSAQPLSGRALSAPPRPAATGALKGPEVTGAPNGPEFLVVPDAADAPNGSESRDDPVRPGAWLRLLARGSG